MNFTLFSGFSWCIIGAIVNLLVHFHMYVKNSCLKLSTSLMPLWDMKWWGRRRRRRRFYTGPQQIGIGKWNLFLILGSCGKSCVWAESDILLLGKKCLVPFLQGVDKSFPLPKKGWVSFPVHCSHWPRPLSVSLLPILNHSFEHTYLTYTFIPFLLWLYKCGQHVI